MNSFIILTDTRQQKENHIIKEFDKQGILHIRTGLPSADYMAVRHDNEQGFYLDYSVLIDTKKDLEEIANNLCNINSHERLKREIFKGKDLGAKEFIFIIGENKIKTAEDIKKWSSPHTKARGEILFKIINTMKERYGVRFMIVPKKDMGKVIIDILNKK